jgi:hypothetical protein
MQPVRADVHQIYRRVFAEGFVGLLLPAVGMGLDAFVIQLLDAGLCTLRKEVADGGHVASGYKAKALYGVASTHTQAHYANANVGNGFGRKLNHILLSRRPLRHRQFNDAACLLAATRCQKQDRCTKGKEFSCHNKRV